MPDGDELLGGFALTLNTEGDLSLALCSIPFLINFELVFLVGINYYI